MSEPTLRVLSLGAGVQSTALLIMAARGELPRLDYAIFADTGWEPATVYAHLDRLEREVAVPAGIPIHRVSVGNIRRDALDPHHRFASMPLYIKNPDGTDGMTRRQCTSEYKVRPIKEEVRRLLGAKPKKNGRPGTVPRGRYVEQWIGISADEFGRAYDAAGNIKVGDVAYARNRYPLLELDADRNMCHAVNKSAGFEDVPKSACIGCPFHTNAHWRQIRQNPADWADAVDFDEQIRAGGARANANGSNLRGTAYLHRARVPLGEAPIDADSFRAWAGYQQDALSLLAVEQYEERLSKEEQDGLIGCSPFGCAGDEQDK